MEVRHGSRGESEMDREIHVGFACNHLLIAYGKYSSRIWSYVEERRLSCFEGIRF